MKFFGLKIFEKFLSKFFGDKASIIVPMILFFFGFSGLTFASFLTGVGVGAKSFSGINDESGDV